MVEHMSNTDNIRTAIVVNDDVSLETIKRYMPGNYKAYLRDNGKIIIVGHDVAGWTMDDYVIPRLASGLYTAQETTDCSHPGGFRADTGEWECSQCGERWADYETWGEQTGNMDAVDAVKAAIADDTYFLGS